MGSFTYGEIVTEAVELAGNTGLATRAYKWLGLIMRELLEKFPAPVAVTVGIGDSPPDTPRTLSTGSRTMSVQHASTNTTVVRSIRRVWLATSGQTDFTELLVEHTSTMEAPPRYYTGVSGVGSGRPQRVIAVGGLGVVTLYFDIPADRNYAVWIAFEGYDEDIVTSLEGLTGTTNPYPNDLTVVQGVYAMCLRHQQDERFQAEWTEFLRLQRDDRARFMNANNGNTRMKLSLRSFRPRGKGTNPWDWMGPK